MKIFFIILSSCIICCATLNSHAQTKSEPDTKEAVGYITNFFNIYKTQGSDKAFNYISTKSNITIWGDKWTYLKSKLDSLNSVLGSFIGYELINERKAAGSLILESYLVKYKNFPLRFTFVFYKPEDHWIIHNVAFDSDDLIEELKQSSKIGAADTSH